MQEYMQRVDDRLARLERTEIGIRQDVARTQQELVRATADLQVELAALHEELAGLDKDLKVTVEHAKRTVLSFKYVVKKNDVARLQNRIDVWAPQDRITRDQLKNLLKA